MIQKIRVIEMNQNPYVI